MFFFCVDEDNDVEWREFLKWVLSLTANTDPTRWLSKSMTLLSGRNFPRIIQSDESSTGKKNVGKDKKQPKLSPRKLQPLNHW